MPDLRQENPGVWLAAALFVGLLLAAPLWAQERLFEQDPFDLITLDRSNEGKVLKVEPLDLPNRQLPERPRPSDKLPIRLVDEPETVYEIAWHTIDKVELFEQLVLGKAEQLVEAKKLDEAYDYFEFLQREYPRLAGLDESLQNCLYEEAKASHRQGQYAGALAVLRELYRRNPKWPGLDRAMGLSTDKLVEEYLAKGDYRSARVLLGNLAECFPNQSVVVAREGQLKAEAAGLLADARKAEQSGDFQQAVAIMHRLRRIWPELPGAEELALSLHQKNPRVVVGVGALSTDRLATDMGPNRLGDWPARRSGRLLYRTLTEFAGSGTEGGQYTCPVGEMTVDALGGRLSVQLTPAIRWSSGEETLSAYDVSRRLLAMADPLDPAYQAAWAELFRMVAVRGVFQVEAEIRRSHVRPDAFLQTVLIPYASPAASREPPLSNGPYVADARGADMVRYLPNPQYFAAEPSQPRVIIERRYSEGVDAIGALKEGEVHVLDRVAPWMLEKIREDANLRLDCYRVPLVHCLIPNMRRPLTSHRAFRRALVYGIHRQAILDHLLASAKLDGCRVLSGPFPAGRSDEDDPIGYAYDESIKPRVYDPHLAVALATISLDQLADSEKKQGRDLKQTPRLVLAHPADEIARVACESIRQELEPLGIPLELREIQGPAPRRIPEDVDLLYAELAIWEPVVDARRLLGEDAVAAGCSPYMRLALRKLDQATNWREVSLALRHVHRVAHDDVAVIPLWQLVDYFAYRNSLQGIGTRPVTLYQHVERWQRTFRYPVE
ncbi:MAG: hypothetical protein A2V70_09980 [Planctomycetes bacterium RBG_13_63_9]|nr:MAG: hypothetical protein A2V70_09980 [Planctomycetes bacterium RBG_13_63_9]